ncbi:MAG TPA: hypothetical protein VEK10_01085 [Steroidobacteraceae bacterium]|nr:hypothetical protein [Steroidobacteraceae bacterium]
MNERNGNSLRGTASATHSATSPQLTATTLANSAAENNKKQLDQQSVHKAWYHYFWW